MFSFFSKIKSLFVKDDSEYKVVRARTKKGRFVADDPSTKKNEAYTKVKVKKKKSKKSKK
tara:strand:- start:287 stop:466 length:180 start_codon:yes stop_codon:yes gene_type:complete